MKRKLLIILCAVVSCFSLALGLTACADKTPDENEWGEQYTVIAAYKKVQELGYSGSLEEFIQTISGKDGADGKSAYQIWLENGNSGSQSDFLEWLKGEQGLQGEKGEDGKDGEDGEDGQDGKDGMGVRSAKINEKGELIIILTDGTEINCGFVGGFVNSEQLQYAAIIENSAIIGYSVKGVGTVSDNEINIPSQYKNKPVLAVSADAFSGCDWIKSIAIPESVKAIGSNAFKLCSGLTEINIPQSVTVIDMGTFFGCSGLAEINIPKSVNVIGGMAFFGCSGLTQINIPQSVTVIEDGAFLSCAGLTQITIPKSVSAIKNNTFSGCIGLAEIIISEGVTTIDANAFYGCSQLTKISIPDSIKEIENFGDRSAFEECPNLQYNEFDNALYLGNERNKYVVLAKPKNNEITSCVINGNTKVILGDTFKNCERLSVLTVQYGVTEISIGAFHKCINLVRVTIPDSVISIGRAAFASCAKLETIN